MREEEISIIEVIEGMAQRLEKAKELAEKGKVKKIEGDESWIVENEEENKIYLVKNSTCTCEDFRYRTNLHKGWCKHRLAVILANQKTKKQ